MVLLAIVAERRMSVAKSEGGESSLRASSVEM